MNFFGVLLDLKSENLKLEKDNILWVFGFSNSEEQKSVSGQQTHQLVFLSLEAILGTKNQNKMIQGICYRGNITQNQRNQKETKGKIKWDASHKRFSLTPFS